jgi:hypothetical protein
MQLRTISALLLLAALSAGACASSAAKTTKWNAAQISEIRRRAAFAMSCDPEDLEIVEVDRDARGRVRALHVVGCERKATYVMAKSGDPHSPPQWTLDVSRLSAQN